MHGLVQDASANSILREAHIQNISAGKLAVLDAYGKFRIPAKVGDTLIISHIGFKDLIKVANENWMDIEQLMFELEPDPVFLPEVVITDFPEYSRFKQMIVETELEPELELYGMSSLPKPKKEISQEDLQNTSIGLSVSIPFDLEGLTKKGREKKKLQEILQNKGMVDLAYRKFHRDWVSEMTLLDGDQLTNFILYCKFEPKYLAETPLYNIHQKMMALLEDFKSEQSES